MSNSTHPSEDTIKLYRTGEHRCSYLPDRQSRTLFVDPDLEFSIELYEELTHVGFRRSGRHLYRPDCTGCSACIPARIPVEAFVLRRKHRRILKRNKDLRMEVAELAYRDQDYQLFERYIQLRHADGDMFPATKEGYMDFLTTRSDLGFQMRLYLGEKLVSVAITDHLPSGLSAVYTFFEPDLDARSLGVYSILSQINLAKHYQLPYLYLGYWVPGCQKMHYKSEYQPLEMLLEGEWQLVTVKSTKP